MAKNSIWLSEKEASAVLCVEEKFLDLLREFGVIKTAKESWVIKANIEMKKNKFANFILFNPVVHKIISSFCLSNFKIETTKARRKDIGINLVSILVMFNNENNI